VLQQDYSDIEYIIVDGESKDKSSIVIESTLLDNSYTLSQIDGNLKLYTKESNIVKFLCEPDKGMYEAINKGIKLATGDIIGLCHSDDLIYSQNTISNIVKRIRDTNSDFLYADGVFVDPNNLNKIIRRWIGGKYSQWKVKHGWLPLHPTCYLKCSLMDKLGLYDEQYKIAADTDLLVRYLLQDDIKVTYLPEFVTRMRMGGMSTDSAKRKKMWQEDIRVYTGHGFKHVTLTKIEKMMWKVPQFILAKLKGEN
jgi:glycosyltransferase